MNRLKLDIQMFSDPYVDFKDYPDTTTPINASNLNKIQTDARDELIDRTTGDMVVESIRTKNMFDSSTLVQGDVAGSASTARVSTRQILYLSAGTYTFSTNMPSTYRYGILIRPSAPPTSTTSSYDSGWQTSLPFTFTISTPGYFMMNFAKTDNTNLTPSNIEPYDFQLEKGSTATAYTPYQNLNPYNKDNIVNITPAFNTTYITTTNGYTKIFTNGYMCFLNINFRIDNTVATNGTILISNLPIPKTRQTFISISGTTLIRLIVDESGNLKTDMANVPVGWTSATITYLVK